MKGPFSITFVDIISILILHEEVTLLILWQTQYSKISVPSSFEARYMDHESRRDSKHAGRHAEPRRRDLSFASRDNINR